MIFLSFFIFAFIISTEDSDVKLQVTLKEQGGTAIDGAEKAKLETIKEGKAVKLAID